MPITSARLQATIATSQSSQSARLTLRREMAPAGLRQVDAGADAEPHRGGLEQHRHQVGDQDHRTAANSRTASRRRARSPSCPGPCSRRRRGSRGRRRRADAAGEAPPERPAQVRSTGMRPARATATIRGVLRARLLRSTVGSSAFGAAATPRGQPEASNVPAWTTPSTPCLWAGRFRGMTLALVPDHPSGVHMFAHNKRLQYTVRVSESQSRPRQPDARAVRRPAGRARRRLPLLHPVPRRGRSRPQGHADRHRHRGAEPPRGHRHDRRDAEQGRKGTTVGGAPKRGRDVSRDHRRRQRLARHPGALRRRPGADQLGRRALDGGLHRHHRRSDLRPALEHRRRGAREDHLRAADQLSPTIRASRKRSAS